jgi:hypothetical protein
MIVIAGFFFFIKLAVSVIADLFGAVHSPLISPYRKVRLSDVS